MMTGIHRHRFVVVSLLLFAFVAGAALSQARVHKLVATNGLVDEKKEGVRLVGDYGSYRLYQITDEALNALPQAAWDKVHVADEMDVIQLEAYPLDTRAPVVQIPSALAALPSGVPALHLVQFVGPIRQAWLDELTRLGVRPVQYIESNAYLVWAGAAEREALDRLATEGGFVQYSGPYLPYFKLGPTLRAPLSEASVEDRLVPVTIQILDHEGKQATRGRIESASASIDSSWQSILSYENVGVTLPLSRIAEIASLPDVTWVEERQRYELMDEVQGQIVAAHFDGSQSGPSGPGYKAFLDAKGFSTDPSAYPIVDVTDDGVGTGSIVNGAGDPTFTKLADGTTTRLNYVTNCTSVGTGSGVGGHGHINTSIVGGYDVRAGQPFRDADGFQRGLGMNPYGRMAMTKIFQDGGSCDTSACAGASGCLGAMTGVIAASYTSGGRISSNSWGCAGCASSYSADSQAYDAGTRDALPGTAGNQELLFVFAAGNSGSGAGTVGTPGNGKNMITVGASENDRPTADGAAWTDGCGIGATGADNAMDVIGFSSRGPSPGGRKKPEVIAPGTHIQGTASTSPSYNGASVCDQFLPTTQTVFAASSGTSHSTPAVAGIASLYYRWLQDHYLTAVPSPALTKAYMMAHTTYLTGVGANDTLPSNTQGYGMPNLEMAFDDTVRYLVDQSVVLDNSGETWTFNGSVADPGRPVRIVMVYTDAPGAVGTSPQVNNLNLSATVDATTYLGNVFSGQYSMTGGSPDTADNYEAVFLPAGTSGALSITVTGFNIAGNGVPNVGDGTDQDFAIVCYNCAQFPDFTLGVAPTSRSICAPASAAYDITIGSILGFNEPATLSTTGLPAGATDTYTVNPVTPPGLSQLTVGNTGAVTPGAYSFNLVATSATKLHTRTLAVTVFDAVPGAPTLLTPADGATLQPVRPTFTWGVPTQAASYTIEIATDPGFTSIVASGSGLTATTFTPSSDLPSNSVLYWRVRSSNSCGAGSDSAVFDFTTVPLPGDCPLGAAPSNVYFIDFEAGATGWTSSGTGNTWALSTTRSWSAITSYHATDPTTTSDQQLVSPAVALPIGQDPLNLIYYNYQSMEDRTGGCFDGGILEISTSGPGGPWTQLEAQLLTDPYDGPINGSGNVLNGRNGWCGDPQDWTRTVVNVTAFAGQTVHFRWHLASDTSVGREGWYLDDVKLQSCLSGPDFTLLATPDSHEVCAPTSATYSVPIGSILGFSEPVTLSTTGLPPGATEAYTVNPVTPPGASQLQVGTAGVSFGTYPLTIVGTSASKQHQDGVSLTVYSAAPAAPALLSPANNATSQPLRPTFSWGAAAQAISYTIEIATDPGFGTIVHSASGLAGTSYTPPSDLASGTRHYWRVRATNLCGNGGNSGFFRFTTQALAGDCPTGSSASQLYFIDFESGAPGWTSGGTGNTWALSTGRSWSATHSYKANDPTSVSDQQLVSPAVALPSGQNPLMLTYYNHQTMENRPGGCFDGGILEISTAGPGGPFTQLEAQLLTDPYDGPIDTCCSNPLAPRNAWCGNPQNWTKTVVDLSAYAGQTVNLRWRLGSDGSAGGEGWYLDDVKVQSCLAAPLSIPPVPDGASIPGTAVKVADMSGDASTLKVTWDALTCTAENYNLYYGLGAQLPTTMGGVYGLSGSLLNIGVDGATGYNWVGTPDPGADPLRLLWWIVVGNDGASTEGSWGRDSLGGERTGPGTGGASGQGPYQTKNTSHTTCP